MNIKNFVSTIDAAEIIGVSRPTVVALIGRGELPAVRSPLGPSGGSYLILRRDALKLARRRQRELARAS